MSSNQTRAEEHHKLQFSANVDMIAQQVTSRIRPYVSEMAAQGEAMSAFEYFGTVRHVETSPTDRTNVQTSPEQSRRWLVFRNPRKAGDYIDSARKMRSAVDPTGQMVRTFVASIQRGVDEICLGVKWDGTNMVLGDGGIMGTRNAGKAPGERTSGLPAAVYTPSGGSGMTLAKLKEALERLRSNEFGIDDNDQMYCAITPRQVTDLLDIADGNGESLNAFQQLQLQSGKPTTLMGLTWVITNLLPVNDAGERLCPIWTKNNVMLGVWQDVKGDMWNDTHADNTPYAKVSCIMDAQRGQDLGVHVITCSES